MKFPADVADDVNLRLRRLEGQIRGLQRMLEEEQDCEKIVTQLAAAKAALDRVGQALASRGIAIDRTDVARTKVISANIPQIGAVSWADAKGLVALGLTADDVKARIDEAAKFMPLDQMALSPQCGFSSTVHGNDIAMEQQSAKMRLVIDVAKDVWGEL